MSLQMDQLGGFVRLGPQVYPQRPNAVQVIQRGPHGMRMAADPVATRRGAERGSGFRFWVEQLNVPADESWNPPQAVVGLMGMGEPAPDPSLLLLCSAGALPKPDLGKAPPPGNGGARSLWNNLNDGIGAACRGRVAQGEQIIRGAVKFFMPKLTPAWHGVLAPKVAIALDYVEKSKAGAEGRLQETKVREGAYTRSVSKWDKDNAEAERKRNARETDCAKKGQLSYARYIATGSCEPVDKKDIGKLAITAALAGAGVLVLYGFAKGLGSGLTGGR